MKTAFYSLLVSMLAVSALFVSCSDDEKDSDTTKPVINLIEPEEGAVLKPGSTIHFEMDLEDNVMLGSYKVEIHSNFDGHTHDTKAEAGNTEETVPFAFNKSWDVSGLKNTHIHHHEIEIPANAKEGNYHLMVYCADAAGNESYIARNIVLDEHGETGEHEDHNED